MTIRLIKQLILTISSFSLLFFSYHLYAADNCQISPSGKVLFGGSNFLKLGPAPDYHLTFGTDIFNYPSVNIFDLLNRYISNDPCSGKQYLNSAAAAGFKSARFFAATYNENMVQFDGLILWKTNPTAFFNLVDRMISDAKDAGIYLIPSLGTGVFDMHETSALASASCTDVFSLPLIPGSNNRTDMKKFMSDWSNRYSQNTTILFWELGNELNLQAKHRNPSLLCADRNQIRSYIDDMSTTIKSFDHNHLIASGAIQEGDPMPMNHPTNGSAFSSMDDYIIHYNNLPNIDFLTLHIYEGFSVKDAANNPVTLQQFLTHMSGNAHSLKKALWIGEYGVASSWAQTPFSNFVQSLSLAKFPLGIDLASAWNWDNAKFTTPNHPEQIAFSIDAGNTDAIAALTQQNSLLGLPSSQNWQFVTGDFNGDSKSDIAAYSDRGLYQVALTGASGAEIASQWLSQYGDKNIDAGFTSAKVLAGDWNGDGKTDVLVKTKDGRWYVALSNGTGFEKSGLWLNNFGNEFGPDLALNAGIQLFAGDWNGDKKTDIGFKTKDGRWYVAFSNGTQFTNMALFLNGFGNENGPDLAINAGTYVVSGDWNGDKRTDIGFKTKDGRWYVAFSDGAKFTNAALWMTGYGNESGQDLAMNAGTTTIVGDWDGDQKTDIGFKTKDGRWYLAFSRGNQFSDTWLWTSGPGNEFSTTDPGQRGGIPLIGNWKGNGKSSFGYRTGDGRIYVNFTEFPNINYWEWLVK